MMSESATTRSSVVASSVSDVLLSLSKKGVRLWVECGELRYKAPKGALSYEDLNLLRGSKEKIVQLLHCDQGQGQTERYASHQRAPLTFSQRAHWETFKLGEQCGVRQIASALRLRGRFDLAALRVSVSEVIRRHAALRTRIVIDAGGPVQEITSVNDITIDPVELSGLPRSVREVQVIDQIEALILEPIDIAKGPLLGLKLLRLGEEYHVLIVAMEHMIADAFSLHLFIRELFTLYSQALCHKQFTLPELAIQFSEYAIWQENAHESWLKHHGPYWQVQAAECGRTRFPEEPAADARISQGWGSVPVLIDSDVKEQLRQWSRQQKTTVVMGVFVAYVATVLRWCRTRDTIVQFVTDGRVSSKIENTMGFFASNLYLRVRLSDHATFVDLLKQLTQEYCQASERDGACYLLTQKPCPAFTKNTVFNWVPGGLGKELVGIGTREELTFTPIAFEHPLLRRLEIDHEPSVLLFDTADQIVGNVSFPLTRFSAPVMARFVKHFLASIRKMLEQPDIRVVDMEV